MAGFNFQKLVTDVEQVAKTAAEVIPGAGLVDEGISIVQAIGNLIDSIKGSGKAVDTADLDAQRRELEKTVGTASEQLSKDLRGD